MQFTFKLFFFYPGGEIPFTEGINKANLTHLKLHYEAV
jgi:hypothetical protein